MFFLPGRERAIVSAGDLRAAGECTWALLGDFDVALGRRAPSPRPIDPMVSRLAELGTAHEQRVLRELLAEHRGRIVQIPRGRGPQGLMAAADATARALAGQATAIYQAAFLQDRFAGFADFLVRDDSGDWQVWDSKLARHESVAALLQVAGYADALRALGVPTARDAVLVFGDGERRAYPVAEIAPVARRRVAALTSLLDSHQDSGHAAQWDDPGIHACGRCVACREELIAHDDVLLVAGVFTSQRKALRAAGVRTLADLAARTEPVADLPQSRLERMIAQARMQREQSRTGVVSAEVSDPAALAALPPPSPGDLFFDFEGDPTWSDPGSHTRGLEYLFGVLEAPVAGRDPHFRAFWAHDRAAERQALIDFVAYVQQRLADFPDLHIYHYADYERAGLLRLAARYGVCEKEIDDLLRAGTLVDLYAIVRSSVRVSQESYSIKKLEPLYMGEDLRSGPVATGSDSIIAYHEYQQAVLEGRQDAADEIAESIRAYNEYDCVSTLRLRDWLLQRAEEHDIQPVARATSEPSTAAAPSATWARAEAVEGRLRELLGDTPPIKRSSEEQALAMVAATVQYNRREQKPYWWRHFDRLRNPVDEWAGQADVVHIGAAQIEQDWDIPPGKKTFKRRLRLTGSLSQGIGAPTPKTDFVVIYDIPAPEQLSPAPGARSAETSATVIAVEQGADGSLELLVEESLPQRYSPFPATPVALAPKPGPGTATIDAALADLAEEVAGQWPALPHRAGIDLLLRTAPRQSRGLFLPPVGEGDERFVTAIRDAVLDLDDSYLAVQGPPGTGKTYVAAQVITALVRDHGWKVGVVAQSHAAIENVLAGLVKAGLAPDLIGKYGPDPDAAPWTVLTDRNKHLPAFAQERQESGYVLGGTAYDLTHRGRVAADQLDLLVVEEAGQYSMANTLACSLSARRLLLLGDPQQLGEVSQGSHPEPVDASALGWLTGGRPTLDPAHGYFLSTTWRMHPALTTAVSDLAYAGQLGSQESVTAARQLEGVDPGVHLVPVPHRDNTVESPEEAAEVVRQVRALVGRLWDDPGEAGPPRRLSEADLRVVTPYNAQVRRLRDALDEAGFAHIPVGTVDKFQGQEGVVVLISMAASARSDVSRGMRFLLDRNRLNVALSRGKWAALLICSPELLEFTPTSTRELRLLGGFLRLVEESAGGLDSAGVPAGRSGITG